MSATQIQPRRFQTAVRPKVGHKKTIHYRWSGYTVLRSLADQPRMNALVFGVNKTALGFVRGGLRA